MTQTISLCKPKVLFLFDVDGTLTLPRLPINKEMLVCLQNLYKIQDYDLGFVGGSDLHKQIEQIGEHNMNLFTWKFSENGLVSYYKDELINKTSLIEHLGEDNYQTLINVCLSVLSETNIPLKRGNFIELRNGMINISPIGRSCSQKERDDFDAWDKQHKIREKIISQIKFELSDLNLQFSIGGQISIDIFPKGWDKTYCLKFIEDKYDDIYFFGDKTTIGGNDYELYKDTRVKGISVKYYTDTMEYLSMYLK
jgi:phosphomannomutase